MPDRRIDEETAQRITEIHDSVDRIVKKMMAIVAIIGIISTVALALGGIALHNIQIQRRTASESACKDRNKTSKSAIHYLSEFGIKVRPGDFPIIHSCRAYAKEHTK